MQKHKAGGEQTSCSGNYPRKLVEIKEFWPMSVNKGTEGQTIFPAVQIKT